MIAPLGRRALRVIGASAVGTYQLVTVVDPAGPEPQPGQFYMLAAASGWGGDGGRPYLSRAFSVCTSERNELGFLLDRVGPATVRLSELQQGEELFVTGPLGNTFSPPEDLAGPDARPLLVAGGVGIPPLAMLDRALSRRRSRPVVLCGFRNAAMTDAASVFTTQARVTLDEPRPGFDAGPVTSLLEEELERCDSPVVYGCGPPAMLEAVRAIAKRLAVPTELALEEAMACGFGACVSCVVDTRDGLVRLCTDGPVIEAGHLRGPLRGGGPSG